MDPGTLALGGDALWASGLFEEAEGRYRDALSMAPDLARGHHGLARALAARTRLNEAMNEAQEALRPSPRDLEVHHTIGAIYERMHRFEEAAGAYTNFVNLLPNKDSSEKADWSRSEIKFLRSFGQRTPFATDPGAEDQTYTIDFRLVNEKIVVRAKVNDGSFQDFVVDTGAENTILTRPTAVRLGIAPITYTLSAGVGDVGLRGLQLARIDSLELGQLKLRNVPCLIKNPPLRDLPIREAESLSPLSLGFSMIIDYQSKKITFGKHLPAESSTLELPLRVYSVWQRCVAAVLTAPTPRTSSWGYGRRGHLDQHGDRDVHSGRTGAGSEDRVEGVRILGLGQGRVPAARCRSRVRHDSLRELPGGGAERLDTPERAARLSAGRDCRPQVPEPVPGRHRSREERAQADADVVAHLFFSRSLRRACASSETRRSSSVSTSSGVTGTRLPSRANRHEASGKARLVSRRLPVSVSSE